MPLIDLLEEFCKFGLVDSIFDGRECPQFCKGLNIPVTYLHKCLPSHAMFQGCNCCSCIGYKKMSRVFLQAGLSTQVQVV